MVALILALLISPSGCNHDTDLTRAVRDNDVSRVKHLLAQGVNVNDGGKTWQPMPDDWKAMIPSFQELLNENSRKDVSKRQQ